jgi:serine/threonine-protein kinase
VGCPGEETIYEFAEGRLAADALARVEAHASSCESCRSLLAVVVGSGSVAANQTAATEVLGPAPMSGESRTEPVGRLRQPRPQAGPTLSAGIAVDRYTILGLIGRGGMGEVYAAHDPSLDRKVALKLMRPEAAARDERGEERLLREAQAIASLSHPNVVVVYDVGTFAGRVYIAMEHVDGITLAEWLAAEARSWKDIVHAFLQAARGLSAAHRAGIVHRDFKPQNVMMAADGTARVMDFGLARRIHDVADERRARLSPTTSTPFALTRTGRQAGTPIYMAPEQFADGDVDARTDQFSYCVALFWALYGQHPFGAGGQLTPGAFAPPNAPRKGVAPSWIRSVLVRGLATDPTARWPSIDDLAKALSRDPDRRRRTLLGLTAAIVGSAALGIGVTRIVERRQSVRL